MFLCFNLFCIFSWHEHVCVCFACHSSVWAVVCRSKSFFFSPTCTNAPFVVCPPIPVGSLYFYLSPLSVRAGAQLCYFPECVCVCVCTGLCVPALLHLACFSVQQHFSFPLFPFCPTLSRRPLLFLSLLTVYIELCSIMCCVDFFESPTPHPRCFSCGFCFCSYSCRTPACMIRSIGT